MKYLILILGLIMSFSKSYSQSKDPLHLFDSTKREATFDSAYKDVKGALTSMADGLKVTVDHLWSVLVYQQRLEAIMWLIITCITFISIVAAFKYYRKDISDDSGDLTKDGWAMVFLIIVSVFMVIAVCCNIENMLQGFFNPEYGALKEIMKTME